MTERQRTILECAKQLCSDCRKGKPVVVTDNPDFERRFFHQQGKSANFLLCNAYQLWNMPDTGLTEHECVVKVKDGADRQGFLFKEEHA